MEIALSASRYVKTGVFGVTSVTSPDVPVQSLLGLFGM